MTYKELIAVDTFMYLMRVRGAVFANSKHVFSYREDCYYIDNLPSTEDMVRRELEEHYSGNPELYVEDTLYIGRTYSHCL